MNPAKPIFSLLLLIVLHWVACGHSPEIGLQPLMGFSERVTVLVTTTVRSQVRDSVPKQQLLITLLPALEKYTTMNELTEGLKGTGVFRDLAYLVEADVMFELQKPEHHRERVHFNSPEIQRQVVSAILAGMRKALDQLQEKKDTN